jgi:hypothetical protein
MANMFSSCGKYSCPGRHVLLLREILLFLQIYSPSAGNTLVLADMFSSCGKYFFSRFEQPEERK